jgi:hypothetical protein
MYLAGDEPSFAPSGLLPVLFVSISVEKKRDFSPELDFGRGQNVFDQGMSLHLPPSGLGPVLMALDFKIIRRNYLELRRVTRAFWGSFKLPILRNLRKVTPRVSSYLKLSPSYARDTSYVAYVKLHQAFYTNATLVSYVIKIPELRSLRKVTPEIQDTPEIRVLHQSYQIYTRVTYFTQSYIDQSYTSRIYPELRILPELRVLHQSYVEKPGELTPIFCKIYLLRLGLYFFINATLVSY